MVATASCERRADDPVRWSVQPYQVNPYEYLRGPQTGYNICNSTTAGDNSECQVSSGEGAVPTPSEPLTGLAPSIRCLSNI